MNAARDRLVRDRMEAILDRIERPGKRASFDEIRELAHLYRLNSARLAILRSRDADPEAVRYLNALCVRAFTYSADLASASARTGEILRHGFSGDPGGDRTAANADRCPSYRRRDRRRGAGRA